MKACDLLLKGATVFDGSGQGRFRADVALSQGRIAAVGQLQSMTAAQSIELDGLALAPGFIDVHTHDDRLLLADPAMVP
ncbi:MAG: D-aminoacylase, partial [Hylemonella sp.]